MEDKDILEFFRKIEEKWQKIWEETKVFEPEIDPRKPKFFITVPYPYMSGLLHLGSAYTFSRGEFIARFKRLLGYNVLWPQGWHITGAPIVGKALRLREGDPKVIKELKDAGIPESEWDKLKTPEGWAMKFIELNKKAFKKFGFSIDWRREFYTTYLNPWYNKFIEWQYRKLREKGLITKGKHPVVWDPKVNMVIGDHDRPDEYAGIGPIEGYIIKFKLEGSEVILPCFTLRPETVYGVTNIWISPETEYAIYRVNEEQWVLPKTIVIEELKNQGFEIEFIEDVNTEVLLGKYAENPLVKMKKFTKEDVRKVIEERKYDISLIDLARVLGVTEENLDKFVNILKELLEEGYVIISSAKYHDKALPEEKIEIDLYHILFKSKEESARFNKDNLEEIIDNLKQELKKYIPKKYIPILPAKFVDPEVGTGIVMSVPAHAPYDYIALVDLTKDEMWKDIAKKCLENMRSLFKLEGFSEFPAKDIVERMQIKSQDERDKLEKATQEIYSKEFYNGILREIFGKYAGKKICEVKDELAKEFVEKGVAVKYYTLPIRFKSRYGGTCIVKIVEDQWFLRYSDPEWKKLAHECVDQMKFIPKEAKELMHQTIDWYKDWACTHQRELGTPLPWDPEWTIESLSDSTIYMAYYTIAHLIKQIPPEKIEDDLFDYVFLGKGNEAELVKKYGEIIKKMREEFKYWYPVDLRTSGKDLLQNHFVFYIFHHVAIFPRECWPRAIAVNGWVLMNGRKMSKSLGNYISMLEAIEKYPIDVVRFLLAYAGNTGFDDANIEISKWKEIMRELYEWYRFAVENYNKGREDKRLVDEWFENIIYKTLTEVEKEYEEMNFKNVLVKGFYELQNKFKWYIRRVGNNPNKDVLKKFIEAQTLILYPIVPHIASEILERIKGKEFALRPTWIKEKQIDEDKIKIEEYIMNLREDIIKIMNITKRDKVEGIKIIIASEEKYKIFDYAKEVLKEYKLKDLTKKLVEKFGKDVIPIAQRIFRDPGLLETYVNQELEIKALEEAREFLEKEFGAKVVIELEEESGEEKARNALPGKPAVILK